MNIIIYPILYIDFWQPSFYNAGDENKDFSGQITYGGI